MTTFRASASLHSLTQTSPSLTQTSPSLTQTSPSLTQTSTSLTQTSTPLTQTSTSSKLFPRCTISTQIGTTSYHSHSLPKLPRCLVPLRRVVAPTSTPPPKLILALLLKPPPPPPPPPPPAPPPPPPPPPSILPPPQQWLLLCPRLSPPPYPHLPRPPALQARSPHTAAGSLAMQCLDCRCETAGKSVCVYTIILGRARHRVAFHCCHNQSELSLRVRHQSCLSNHNCLYI